MNAQPPCKIIKPTFFVEPTGLECGMDFQGQQEMEIQVWVQSNVKNRGFLSRRNDETAVQRGGNSWRDWSKLGTRTLAKLEARRRHYLLTGEHSECLLKRYE